MKKRPVYFSLAISLFVLSAMFTYFTMYCNVHDLDLFFNRTLGWGNDAVGTAAPTGTEELGSFTPGPATPSAEEPVPTDDPEPYQDITLAFTGDFLIHDNILTAQYDSETKTYDFNSVFSEIAGELAKADFTAASLEVPFGGTAAGTYAGYPKFNCPDALGDALAQNKVQLLFTAGVHAFDAGTAGMTRTLAVLKQNNLFSTGTREKSSDLNYVIADVSGVQVGFLNYTAGERRSDGRIHMNGIALTQEQEACLNVFSYDALEAFYTKLEQNLTAMKTAGAEVLIVGIRWGTDYTTKTDANQQAIAQKLCDMGVDIIAGNGPHMIQPFAAITSEVSGKTTLCMYSLGNFLSNQRKELIRYDSGHTEDGILYAVNLRKQADGTILLGKVQYVPTWVSLTEDSSGKPIYRILPVSENMDNPEGVASCKRTQDIVAEGVAKYNNSVSDY